MVLQKRIWHHRLEGGAAAALDCDEPGGENSGSKVYAASSLHVWAHADAQGVEYPTRFFARDFAGNRLEFAVLLS
jgi:hypothetical protein